MNEHFLMTVKWIERGDRSLVAAAATGDSEEKKKSDTSLETQLWVATAVFATDIFGFDDATRIQNLLREAERYEKDTPEHRLATATRAIQGLQGLSEPVVMHWPRPEAPDVEADDGEDSDVAGTE
jgi:hypothetical protein